MQLSISLDMPIAEKPPILWENANVQATWLWLSVWDIYIDQQWTVDGQESFGMHEIVSEVHMPLVQQAALTHTESLQEGKLVKKKIMHTL